MEKINLIEKFAQIPDHWNPRIAASLNGQHVKFVKLKGAFTWHSHEQEDELFLVIDGSFDMEFRDRTVTVSKNEMLVVPKGVEHRPVAHEEASVILFEPSSTLNTGNVHNEFTRQQLDQI